MYDLSNIGIDSFCLIWHLLKNGHIFISILPTLSKAIIITWFPETVTKHRRSSWWQNPEPATQYLHQNETISYAKTSRIIQRRSPHLSPIIKNYGSSRFSSRWQKNKPINTQRRNSIHQLCSFTLVKTSPNKPTNLTPPISFQIIILNDICMSHSVVLVNLLQTLARTKLRIRNSIFRCLSLKIQDFRLVNALISAWLTENSIGGHEKPNSRDWLQTAHIYACLSTCLNINFFKLKYCNHFLLHCSDATRILLNVSPGRLWINVKIHTKMI